MAEPAEQTTGAQPMQWASPEFGAIYEEHSKAIYFLTLRMLGDPSAAEDATHDVFLKAYRKMGEFRGESGLRTWLYRIAVNHCHNIQQSWHQRNVFPTENDEIFESTSNETNPLRVLETKELGTRIQQALEALPEEYRLLLLLVADEKMSYDEVGTLTGQTADAVRGKLHRARKAFQQHFQKTA